MNRLILHLYLNLNYDYINSVNLVLTIIISPHLVNSTDKIFVFFGKELRNVIPWNIEPQYYRFFSEWICLNSHDNKSVVRWFMVEWNQVWIAASNKEAFEEV